MEIIYELFNFMKLTAEALEDYADEFGFHAEIKEDGMFSTWLTDRRHPFRIHIQRDIKLSQHPEKALVALGQIHGWALGYKAAQKDYDAANPVDFGPFEEVKETERRDQD